MSNELAKVARAALDYIDALPADVVAKLPTMPGFDRDWAEEAIKTAESHCICSDVESVLGLLEGNEWAEHCVKTPLGNRLESAITEMVGNQITNLMQRAEAAENLAAIRGEQLVAKSHIQPMSDHEIRETVNQLRDIAKEYGHTQQLRERIAHCIVDKLKCVPARELPAINPGLLDDGALLPVLMEAYGEAQARIAELEAQIKPVKVALDIKPAEWPPGFAEVSPAPTQTPPGPVSKEGELLNILALNVTPEQWDEGWSHAVQHTQVADGYGDVYLVEGFPDYTVDKLGVRWNFGLHPHKRLNKFPISITYGRPVSRAQWKEERARMGLPYEVENVE